MDKLYQKNRWTILLVSAVVFTAGLMDIKYKGLFYQRLPESVRSYLRK